MFIELIDLLRCTRPHEDSWLVAAIHDMRDRVVVEGLLSCPVCGARFPVTGGTAYFDVNPGDPLQPVPASPPETADGARVAAYLNLVEPGVVLLGGGWGAAAGAVGNLGSRIIAFNSPGMRSASGPGPDTDDHPAVSRVRSAGPVPLARACLDGAALDHVTVATVDSATAALKVGARLVAPADVSVPDGFAELARDERWWIAAREGAAASAPVQISRRS